MQTSNPVFAQLEAARAATAAAAGVPSFDEIVEAEDRAAGELARSPCANDDEFFAKAAYLLEWEKTASYYGVPTLKNDFGSVLVALCEYLKQRGGRASDLGRQ